MRTGESRGRTFAHLLRSLYKIIKETMVETGTGQQNIIVIKIISNRRKVLRHHVIHADGGKVKLRTGYRDQYINKIIDENEVTNTKDTFSNHSKRKRK